MMPACRTEEATQESSTHLTGVPYVVAASQTMRTHHLLLRIFRLYLAVSRPPVDDALDTGDPAGRTSLRGAAPQKLRFADPSPCFAKNDVASRLDSGRAPGDRGLWPTSRPTPN